MYNPYYQQYRPSQAPQYAPQPQAYTPPTIHADIIQVADESEAEAFGVAAGTTMLMCAKDDSAFYVKTAYPNGQCKLDIYDKRPPKQVEKPDYITRAELQRILSDFRKEREQNEYIRQSEQSTATSDATAKYCTALSTVPTESD